MKILLSPLVLASVGVAVLGMVIGQWPLAVLGGVLMLGSLAFAAAKSAQRQVQESGIHDLDPEARALLKPLRDLHAELETVVSQNADMTSVRVVGGEALQESQEILAHAAGLAARRSALKKTLRGRSEAQLSASRLKSSLEQATGEERAALEAALAAHEEEIRHYEEVQASMDRIDGKVRQAQAALSELKARIAVGAAGERAESTTTEELSDLVTRLKALSASFSEAEEVLEERVR